MTVLISPLILFFTISKWPDRKSIEEHHSLLPPQTQTDTIRSAPSPSPVEITQTSKAWNVPYRRNPFFTGREDLLKQLHDRLTVNRAAALTQPQAINGLGGIGKTQIAVEYAYRYRDEYQAVLWVWAATRETLITDFMAMAALLHLAEQNVADQHIVIAAVKERLEGNRDWLLILDNADDIELASDFLPRGGNERILLTTRVQATGSVADAIEVEKMNKKEGVLLLLRRAKLLSPDVPLSMAPIALFLKCGRIKGGK